MYMHTLKPSNIQISSVIMGTWQAGKAMWSNIDDTETTQAIQAAFDAGITTFDTAEVYGNGHSERIVGKALGNVRDKVVLATKVFSNHLKYDQVIQACNRSLKNLGTDYIDLYQIHWPPGSFGHAQVPLEESMQALADLKEQGKIRSIGVSNFNAKQIQSAMQHGLVESLQPPYSLFWRSVEKETLPYCRSNGITILAYSPMAQGLLTGKFGPGHTFPKGDHRSSNRLFQGDNYTRAQDAITRLQPIADQYGITLAQLALAWVMAQPNTCAIAGARNSSQALENAAAADIRLSDDTLKAMDAISRSVTDHLDDDPVLWKW